MSAPAKRIQPCPPVATATWQAPSRRALVRGLVRTLGAAGAAAALESLAGCGIFESANKKQPLPGHRIDILSTGEGLQPTPLPKGEPPLVVNLPAPAPLRDWTLDGRVADHTAFNGEWAGTGKELWSHSIGAGSNPFDLLAMVLMIPNNRGAIQSPPVIGQGRIFTTDAQGVVRAWTWPNMHELWHRQPGKHLPSTNIGGGVALDGDTLYIVDGVATALAVDAATGKPKWVVPTKTPGRSAPTISNGMMAFITIDERLYVLDAKSGRQLWTHQAPDVGTVIFGEAAPAMVPGVVLAGFGSGELVALRDTTGEMIWSDNLSGGNGRGARLDFACVRGAPVIMGRTAYAISMLKVLVAIDVRSGRRLWEREVSGQNMLCVCGDWLYLVSLDQQLACVHRMSGHVKWVRQLPRFKNAKKQRGAIEWVGPVLAGSKLVCFSSVPKYGMAVVDALSGKLIHMGQTSSPCQVAPIACDGRVLAVTQDGVLHAYG
ncbi:PQQ-binding-like beta-propeller repeat protein [Formicincola oecophyllae]|uniref:PQQ-binding-like beta-propeller repeat protein n=1 Tax=Formicincola oecophyllae TaxID=2558361 RepID=A0A4Y6U8Z1_9PROT|nr:PQQ-binding-like beta-propeller repeat protein [Formicincola oecophyllae]QDH12916.1 PQQ-binding-like beta-propeller repeat protein [Formicincola oecophyllae]